MFHVFRDILDRRHPRRAAGFFVGAGIVYFGMTLLTPGSHLLAALGNDDDPPALSACADDRATSDLYRKLRERYISLRKDTLAVDRERRSLEENRARLFAQLQDFDDQRRKLDTRMTQWEKARSAERQAKLDQMVNIIADMQPAKAAALLARTDADRSVEIIYKLEQKRAAEILALLPPERAAIVLDAIDGPRR